MEPSASLYDQLKRLTDQGKATDNLELFRASLLSDDPYVRWAALKGVGTARDVDSIPDLLIALGRDCLDLGGTDEQRVAAWALGRFPFEELEAHLARLDWKMNPRLAAGLADMIGELADPRLLPLLLQLMTLGDQTVMLWATLSAAKIGKPSLPYLVTLLTPEPEIWRVFYALDALNRIATSEALSARRSLIVASKYKEIRQLLKDSSL